MMITLHGLPLSVKYQDVKLLIKQECKIHDFILDNLIIDGNGSKKVRVGLTDVNEGNHLMKCLDGFRMSGNVLHVMPVGKPGQMTHPQQGSFDTSGFPRANFQNTNEFGRPEEQRPGPWAADQWTSNQVLPQAHHNIFQQHAMQNNTFVQQVSHQVRPAFEPHGRGPQVNIPRMGFQNKNLIELGSPRGPQPQARRGDNPDAFHRPTQGGRYPVPHYDMRQEQPITIMKDNFQNLNQLNTGSSYQMSSHNQGSGHNPVWSQPNQKTQFARPIQGPEKMDIVDRKYPQGDRPKPVIDKMDDYKGYKGSGRFSPRRGTEFRGGSPGRRSPHRHTSGRPMSPSGKRISPDSRQAIVSGRQMSPSGGRMSPNSRQALLAGRQMSPPGRRMSPNSRQAILSGRQLSPSGRRTSPNGRQAILSGRQMSPSGRRISPNNRQFMLAGRQMSPSGRRMSPNSRQVILSGRQMSPPARRISPSTRQAILSGLQRSISDRRVSPSTRQVILSGRQMSPGRRLSPSSRQDIISDRQMSPSRRRISPINRQAILTGRQVSPGKRRISPNSRQAILSGRQMSPSGRRISPNSRQAILSGRQMSPSSRRISPNSRQAILSGRQMSPSGRRITPNSRQAILSGRQMSPSGRRLSPNSRQAILSGRQMSPSGRISPNSRQALLSSRQMSPPGRRVSPSNRQTIISGRQISPSRRRMSPSGRQFSPGRRNSPSGRRITPERQVAMGMGISQSGRVSPSGRHMVGDAPGRVYPGSRVSPSRKEELLRGRNPMHRDLTGRDMDSRMHQLSPNMPRRASPSGRPTIRVSPSRHHIEKNLEKYEDHQDMRGPNLKHVRPAYEPNAQASNQAMYSGGFRPNTHGEKQYTRGSPGREQHWQEKDKFLSRNVMDQRRDKTGIQKFDIPRASDHQRVADQDEKKIVSRTRDSRSPRRDRSPIRDRFRRHSPSPRSPRRSWALEKRRSPETQNAPPPPIWPGNDARNAEYQRQQFSERGIEKRVPVWERKQEEPRGNRPVHENQRNFESDSLKPKWKPISKEASRDSPPRFVEGDRFQSQRDAAYRRKEFGDSFKREDKDVKIELNRGSFAEHSRRDYEEARSKKDFQGRNDSYKRDDFIRQEVEHKDNLLLKQEELQKEIDDVYKRAVDFAKKAELYRKGEHKRDSNYDEDRTENYKADRYDKEQSYTRDEEMRSRRNDDKFQAKDTDWNTENVEKNQHVASAIAKEKRNRAVDEISEKMMSKYGVALSGDIKNSVHEELKLSLSRMLLKMFGGDDVSFIEIVVKYNAKYTPKDEEKMFKNIMTTISSNSRGLKRPATDVSTVHAKSFKHAPESKFSKDKLPIANVTQSWNVLQPNVAINAVPPIGVMINPPVMVPVPNQYQFVQPFPEITQPIVTPEMPKKDGHSLYLCKDDFQPFMEAQSENLKNFLVQQLILFTETSQGWAPDFTLNKQNSAYRYEVVTRDERSKDWLLSLDFSEFKEFNVLVYTTEELWYERAAIWLPGHSRCRNIEPLAKLKLQNKKLEGVNIGKWKFVKKIVIEKGTRVYVDMPPSSARALEKHKMMLSYELQKVNVFLKAVAVDKDVFDTGLNEPSLMFLPNPDSTVMPLISHDPNIVNISLKGNKPLSLTCARKIKDMIIYQLFKYHQLEGKSRTDFIKYGFCQPGYLAVVPENQESKKWICSLNIGKLNRQPVVIVGAENRSTRYFKMIVDLPKGYGGNSALACERLRQSNQGLKGMNFNMWRNGKIITDKSLGKGKLEVEMDLESVETITKMKYQLDYVEEGHEFRTVMVKSEHSRAHLEETISKYKAELIDTYVVANMEISSESEDDDVVCYD